MASYYKLASINDDQATSTRFLICSF